MVIGSEPFISNKPKWTGSVYKYSYIPNELRRFLNQNKELLTQYQEKYFSAKS